MQPTVLPSLFFFFNISAYRRNTQELKYEGKKKKPLPLLEQFSAKAVT